MATHLAPDLGEDALLITRVAERHWHALADDEVIGRGETWRRPDGRLFVSIDAWHPTAFGRLAQAILVEVPEPLYTVVDEADAETATNWRAAGFAVDRRERVYLIPTDVGDVAPPAGVKVIGLGLADEARLRELDRRIRAEIEAGIGWRAMPAEVLIRPEGTVLDVSKYAVATTADQYVGYVRVANVTRLPRIGLVGVLAGRQRQGIAAALLAHVLTALHHCGIEAAMAETDETNTAAIALLDSFGAQLTGSNVELMHG